jgi:ABC-2 type transport system ATP-binding protein/lipopolysaccharide transport system ATP-binding protein
VDAYLKDVNAREAAGTPSEQPGSGEQPARTGSGEVRVTRVEYLDADGQSLPFALAGEPVRIRVHVRAVRAVDRAVVGLGFVHESGAVVAGPNSGATDRRYSFGAGDSSVDFVLDSLPLQPGAFLISTAIVDRGHMYDYADRAFELRVRGSGAVDEPGLVRLAGRWGDVAPVGSVTGGAASSIDHKETEQA